MPTKSLFVILSLVSGVVATGCGADAAQYPNAGPDGGGDGGSGDGGDGGAAVQVTVAPATAITTPNGAVALPALHLTGGKLFDEKNHPVIIRGVNAEGIANIITGRASQGGVKGYLDKVVGNDATGAAWNTRIIRLPFERYPCTDRTRLYQFGDARIPYSVPDIHVPALPSWTTNTAFVENTVVWSGSTQYIASKRKWRA